MVTIKIESNEISEEEADNLMEAMLTHYGWACFVDKVYIGTKKVYDCEDKQDQKWIHNILEERSKRIKRLREIKSSNFATQSAKVESLIADKREQAPKIGNDT